MMLNGFNTNYWFDDALELGIACLIYLDVTNKDDFEAMLNHHTINFERR